MSMVSPLDTRVTHVHVKLIFDTVIPQLLRFSAVRFAQGRRGTRISPHRLRIGLRLGDLLDGRRRRHPRRLKYPARRPLQLAP